MNHATDTSEIRKGLNGVVADVSAISKVNPETNSLLYRGYPVPQLAATQSFEAVAHLLWTGELPDADELTALQGRFRAHRDLDPTVKQALDALPNCVRKQAVQQDEHSRRDRRRHDLDRCPAR